MLRLLAALLFLAVPAQAQELRGQTVRVAWHEAQASAIDDRSQTLEEGP